ncbi:centrosomal protein of 192 kDa isoform X9 [Molossus molossus]|uniref:centrosomal protein of 192 kDa isoform X9 n=1 Tax=Molossus molossus TaxID=27622 RepID=UPI0017479BA5|nr:centrosomal protein of 192 kDa isoform X9 [Molossus molossus]
MEDFRGIAEETFPSFLTNSLLGNSGILENVTLSSNLGLPVAVSTLARNKSSTDNRYSDIQASYLVDGRFSVPSESSPSSQSEGEPREKLQLSFQDDDDSVAKRKNHIESQHLSDAVLKESAFPGDLAKTEEEEAAKPAESFQSQDPCVRVLPLEQVQDSPIDFCLRSWMNNKENKIVVPDPGTHFEDKNPNNNLSHTSLIENEKLMSLTSLEESSDGDIDDEEFYDDHLEAYFEQLAVPGMIYEDLEGQDSPEKDFSLPRGDPSQANENSSLNCKSQSENNSSVISHGSHSSGNSEITRKESEEGHVVCLPGTNNSIDNGNSRRHVDGVLPFFSTTLRIEKEKERTESSNGILHCDRESTREEVLVKTISAANAKLTPVFFRDTNVSKGDFDLINPLKLEAWSPHQNKSLASDSDSEIPKVSIQKNINTASLKPSSDNRINSTDILQLPSSERQRTCESYESIEKSLDQTDLPQNIVYQNKEGRWVTDLAYYTSFSEEQDLNMLSIDEPNEDFRTGSEALELIVQDEEEFNKEHQFMQEENIDAQNTSVTLGNTLWGTSMNYNLLRKSFSASDLDKDDASYLRLSLGEFFAQRSEALGCLGGGNSVKRPSFGYFIRSPEKREPIALIRKSDLSRSNLEKEMAHLNRYLISGDLNEHSKAQLSEGSVTLQAEELESISQVDENDVTLTGSEGKTEDTFFLNSQPERYKGNVRVPEELKFPHACCVGIASQTQLSVLNPTTRWLQVSIGVLSVSVNGEKVDLSAYPVLVFKNKVIIRPHATEEIKVLFIPSSPGIFRCIFSVASWPFTADAETAIQAEALASRVILTAVAETPVIEVETEKKDVLDFGDLTYGGWKALPLKLINKTHAIVPIRLTINANAISWHCFTFSKEPICAALNTAPYADMIAHLATPSVISHMMPASFDGQDPEFLIIWVLFHNPKKQTTSSEILDSAEEFLARVDIEVDSLNPTPVIKSIGLRARTGVARIHAPKDLQTMHLFASMASSAKQHLPLKNAGNIDVYLDIKIPDQGSHFSVIPETLFLKPGEEHEIVVLFTPKDSKASEERILKIFVQPFGPQYEVVLKGEVVSSRNKPVAPASCCSDIPSILSNKQFLAWGGVPLGRTQLQKLALRNNSTSTAQHLRLLIRGQDHDCFQLQHTFGSEERLTSNCEIKIRPKEDINIFVLFAPTRLSCMLAKLEIKQLGIQSQPGIKFTIPLSGYGGTSTLILEDVKKLPDSYMVTVNDLIPGKESRIVFSIHNTGSRAAFVKAVGFKDAQKKVFLDPKVLRIFPDKFVLKEKTQEDVTIIYTPADRDSSHKTTTELSTIYFFGGDEISRQQYRRALLHKPEILEQILPEHSVLQSIDFAEAFHDELLVTEVYDLPQQPNDIQLFYGNMSKIILSVIGEFRDSLSGREFLQPSSKANLESESKSDSLGKHGGNVSLDVLPVKGPQSSPLSQVVHLAQDKSSSEEMWTVQPEHLILVAPSTCDLAKTGRFQILNNSVRLLKFELYWPAHCLMVTPQHGFIEPESKLQILVSPNSSSSTKHSMFPWSGLIYIHCDNGQKKIVKVQIQEDLTQEELLTRLASSPFGIPSLVTEPLTRHLVKPMTKPPSTKVEIRNKTVTFPTTEPGETSENYLELQNHGNTEVKWYLSSLAPPYVKGVDESGDVFRATYAAFRCSPISGTMESHGIQKVSITFLPRDRGDYAQFWNVECHPLTEPHMNHTLRFQLSGQSVKAENEPENSCISTNTLIKIDNLVKTRRQAVSEASALIPGRQLDLTYRGIYAPEDMCRFPPTRVGESRTLKVNLRNNSFITHVLKFLSPREPFYVKHSKYSLRAQHYINMPVQFKPKSVGKFEALLVVQTDEGKSVAIRLIGEALEKN